MIKIRLARLGAKRNRSTVSSSLIPAMLVTTVVRSLRWACTIRPKTWTLV